MEEEIIPENNHYTPKDRGLKIAVVGGAGKSVPIYVHGTGKELLIMQEAINKMDNVHLVEELPSIIPSYLDNIYKDELIDFKLSPIMDDLLHPTPNKLKLLKALELSPEQIDYFKNAPLNRMEGESQKDYKNRRMLNKLIIKYRGLF